MINIHSRCDIIHLPVANRCHFNASELNFLWLLNTYTKEMYVVKNYNPLYYTPLHNTQYDKDFIFTLSLDLPECFPFGEYEYFLTPDDPNKYLINLNNIQEIETNIFKYNILNKLFIKNNIIFAESGESIFENNVCCIEPLKKLRVISSGILKYSKDTPYHERDPERETSYCER